MRLLGNKNLLIIGGSSFVGRHLLAELNSNEYLSTYCSNEIRKGIYFNASLMGIKDIIKENDPFTEAILLLGDTDPDSCISNPQKSRHLNVDSIKVIIDDLLDIGIKPIFASTEFVFDGTKGDYIESDKPNPILLYGQQKLEIENYIIMNSSNYSILRFAKIYGMDENDGTLFTNWIKVIRISKTIKCANDQIFSPICVDDVVSTIFSIVNLNLKGLYHVGGPSAFSRIQLLRLLLENSGIDDKHVLKIESCGINDFVLPEKRPLDVSFNIDRLLNDTRLNFLHPSDACKILGSQINRN